MNYLQTRMNLMHGRFHSVKKKIDYYINIIYKVEMMINWTLILTTIMFLESGHLSGDARLNAKGDYWNGKHHSFGCMQIQPHLILTDVNRVYNTSYSYEDCFIRIKSHEIAKLYLSYWIKRYELNTGKKATFRDYLKCWNGGCHWYKKTDQEVINKLNKYADKGVNYVRRSYE